MPHQDDARTPGRPSPDALLAEAAREHRGRLKIFLGAAPGVGKTYAMLVTAQALCRDGVDVVAGIVESHGRQETEALIRGLEVIPRRPLPYKGRILEEMDLDAILARRPKVVLVDELAHTNIPGSRHLKRWLDIEELLAAGIDVLTTVNIQHLESLNDVVARITRIRVRETVPDSVIDRADEVELIDLTPEHLSKRLAEGKVYVREQAQRALAHYFSPGNLTALRELALRCTARRVDDQMLSYMRSHAIPGPWAAGERVLVCIDERPLGAVLVRTGKRIADRLRAKWAVLHVETGHDAGLSDADHDRIADTLRLAERLGATTLTLPGRSIAEEVVAYARNNNITEIVIGRSDRRRWFGFGSRAVASDLMERAGSISIHVIADEPEGERLPDKTVRTRLPEANRSLWPYLASTLMVAGALGVGFGIDRLVDVPNLSLVFLMAVLGSATLYGLKTSLFTSLLGVATYNFFFLPPLYSFTVADPANVVALVFFFLAAVLTSQLAAASRAQIAAARRRARTTAELYAFSRKLTGIGTLDDLLWATAHQIAMMLKLRVVILMPAKDGLAVRAGYPPEDQLTEADVAAAQWAWDRNKPAGRGADTLPGARWLFLPLRTERGAVAVIGLSAERSGPLLTPDERRLIDALGDQAAIAIERIGLAEDVDENRILAETERLRSALLSSLSHDLRTPLSSILGAATSLQRQAETFDAASRADMVSTIRNEAERMNRFVNNLLDMTRIESGALAPKQEIVDLADTVGTALERMARTLADHRVDIDMPADLPMVRGDFMLLEQVVANLLDNAAKYAPPGSTITVRGLRGPDGILLTIADEGPGIPEDRLELVFDKFYRVHATDRQRAGTGLGLAICRGFIEAIGGTIVAANRLDRPGAALAVTLLIGMEMPNETTLMERAP